ncbi:MAG: NAD(P)-dependent oxidoreductase [Actinomycetota bacterium]|nr:NAD(P)-dependent oxidoreductase [Actinomycetota bacterium]
MITGTKILVTGVTGAVATPLAEHLAKSNEVWGVARFNGPSAAADRERLHTLGITTRSLDLGDGDFSELPDDFTYVLHLSWMRAGLDQLEASLRTNVEGAGLLLQHCRKAKAALVMSGMGIYSAHDDPWHEYTETDPIGRGSTAYAPTSPASKLGVEAVARFCARAFDLPVVIPRLNTFHGVPGSFPGMHIQASIDGRSMIAPTDPNPHTPIHFADMALQLEALLDAAGTHALITNWCGDETVTAQEWMQRANELSANHPGGGSGRIEVRPAPGSPAGTRADPTRRRSITGPCTVPFWPAFDEIFHTITRQEQT